MITINKLVKKERAHKEALLVRRERVRQLDGGAVGWEGKGQLDGDAAG